MKYTEREAVVVGALLHDIGKFVQRAQPNPKEKPHTEWGIEWFEKPDGLREKPRLSSVFSEEELQIIDSAISTHHHEIKYISQADAFSAGMDRISLEAEEGDPFNERLINIFSVLYSKNPQYTCISPLGNTASLEEIFPISQRECCYKDYSLLLQNFEKEIKSLNFENLSYNQVINIIYFLLWKYLWCIPSACYKSEPDVSLFDHLKTTAAIATCLYYIEKKNLSNNSPFIIACGDISGIQKFIYNLSSKAAAKGLKGRSFYLQLFSESIAKNLLRKTGYYIPNLLYCGGGRFYILLDSECEERIFKEVDTINNDLLKRYNGELYLSFGISTLTANDFLRKQIPSKIREAAENANKSKRQKFVSIKYETLFEPFGKGGKEVTCDICGKEDDLKKIKIGKEEINCCKQCDELIKLGTNLSRHRLLLEVYNDKSSAKDETKISYDILNTSYYFVKKSEDLSEYRGDEIILYSINSPKDFLNFSFNIGYGFKFIGGNFAPMKNDEILTFDDLAENSKGINRLGVLRMDVDDLGQVFIQGFGGNASISKISALSRNLDIFFNGYINVISRKYENKVYIIYSGGDDVFIVGNWDVIPEIAKDIYENFRKFTCNKLTLSCGIFLAPPKYPIYKSAEFAKVEEDKAKEYKRNGSEKNAISFINTVVDWNDFNIAKDITDLLVSCIETCKNGKKLNKGIIDKLRGVYFTYERNKKFWNKKRRKIPLDKIKERIKYNLWMWRSIYYLHRYSKENSAFKEEIDKIKTALFKDEFNGNKSHNSIIDYLILPVRWTEFLLRKEGR